MRNTVNSWGTNPQISSISLFHRPRNPVKINSEARLVWFVLTKVPEMDTQLFSLLFGNTPIKCHEYFAKNRGGWDYVARRWSQVRVPFLAAFPSTHAWSLPLPHTHTQTHCAQHLLMRHSTGKSLATTVLSSIYICSRAVPCNPGGGDDHIQVCDHRAQHCAWRVVYPR